MNIPLIYRSLSYACLALALMFIVMFLSIAMLSVNYPFHLEWMEGQSIDTIARVAKNRPIYTEPTLEYVPFIYTPLYFYVSGMLAKLVGVDFFVGRLVSILSILATGVLLFAWVRKEGGDRLSAWVAAGIFFATYPLSGRWFDVARVDSLFVCLSVASMYVFIYRQNTVGALLTAALLTAAFFTKQSALIIAAPVLAAMFLINRHHALVTAASLTIVMFTSITIANLLSDDWFNFYVFEAPSGHWMDWRYFLGFWAEDMAHPLPLAMFLVLLCLIQLLVQQKKGALLHLAFAAGLVGSAYVSRLHWGGYSNVLIPAHLCLALYSGLALALYGKYFKATPHAELLLIVPSMVLSQLLLLIYNPVPFVPTKESVRKGEVFLSQLSLINGDIFMPEMQFVQTRVGKRSYSFGMAGFDILRADLGEKNYIREKLRDDLAEAITSQRFAAVMPGRLIHLREAVGLYELAYKLEYPQEYVTGAINFVHTNLYVPIISPKP